LISLKN